MRVWFGLVAAMVLAAGTASGQGTLAQGNRGLEADAQLCADARSPDMQIERCTRVIDSGKLAKPQLAIVYSNRASGFLRRGDTRAALKDANTAIDHDGMYGPAFRVRAMALSESGKAEAAMDDFAIAIRINPRDLIALIGRGRAHLDRRAFDRAREDFTRAITINSAAWPALLMRGRAFGADGRYEEALADFNEAAKLRPDEPDILIARAVALRNTGERDRSNADFDAAIRLRPALAASLADRDRVDDPLGWPRR